MCVKAGPSENEPLQGYNLMEEYCATEAAMVVCLSVISEGFFFCPEVPLSYQVN